MTRPFEIIPTTIQGRYKDRVSRQNQRPSALISPASLEAFDLMKSSFEEALRRNLNSVSETYYYFATHPVRVRVAGKKLARHFLPALSHLEVSHLRDRVPRLTIDFWDESETGVVRPIAFPSDTPNTHNIWAASPDSRFLADYKMDTLLVLDRKNQSFIGSFAKASELSMIERAKLSSRPLALWYQDRGIPIIHAGMVARDGVGVLFAGEKGSGKSTCVFACVCSGFRYLGDDHIGLEEKRDGSFVGHSLFASGLLAPDALARFPRLSPHALLNKRDKMDKALLLIPQIFPARLERTARIRTVVFPRTGDVIRPRLRSAKKGEALLALAPNSLWKQVSPNAQTFGKIARLIERVDCYWMDFGNESDQIAQCVEGLFPKNE